MPSSKKKQLKVCVGDDTGVLTCFEMKRGEARIEWKSDKLGREISSVVLQMNKDKAFCGCGQSIHGFTRKGKEFVMIKSKNAEVIQHIFVEDNMIWTGGEYSLNIYDDCNDAGFVMVKDRINAILCAPVAPGDNLSSVLACQDRSLRVYAGEQLYHEMSVEGAATALKYYSPMPDRSVSRRVNEPLQLMYGTEQGHASLFMLTQSTMQHSMNITDRLGRAGTGGDGGSAASRRSRITAMHATDFMESGVRDVILAREDGSLEVWTMGDALPNGASKRQEAIPPSKSFEENVGECIQAVDAGNIVGGDFNDIVLSTFGGKIVGYSPDIAAKDPTGADMARQEIQQEMKTTNKSGPLTAAEENVKKIERERRYRTLENEVRVLKERIEEEKQKYGKLSTENIAVQSTTKVSHRFNLDVEQASYILVLESQAPLEMISLCADVDVDLLDHEGTSAILSRSKGDGANPLLATYRMQDPGRRFQIRLRTVEGLQGQLSCFVLPQTNPKTAHLISLQIKPLSLHEKIPEVPADIPMSELRLSGPFTVMDMHTWLGICVNELPSRPTEDEMVIAYKSTFVGTCLYVKYGKGYATFRSDSITTISVLKDTISREATARKIQLSINVDVKDETFPRFLELIHPKLAFQHSLTQQVRLVEPLREVQLQETDVKFLSMELQMILEHASEIQTQYELQPARLAFLHNILMAAFKHKWRLKGHLNVDHKLKELQKLLENYDIERVTAFFGEPID
eukprot:CAMPEP_0178415332 /NCGR_PEP_ID=MMETSP0689_2-20121128/23496_1 /TAXON_ID=160604 /ORGANISM="Amphidinium massartii, Strain CS-259" /LENGTH=740 /DNA_ID=CAMNT_0020036647 /DNA_START=123 /DNA_END=2345 /DNA_ORIENTATION=-